MTNKREKSVPKAVRKVQRDRVGSTDKMGQARSNPREPGMSIAQRVSQLFREARRERGLTLTKLQEAIIDQSKGQITKIALSHLNRIENGDTRPTDVELYWINEVLEQPLGPIFGARENYPWSVIRSIDAEERLTEIRDRRKNVERRNNAHEHFINKLFYRYVPLVGSDLVRREDRSQTGSLSPKFFVQLIEFEVVEHDEMTDKNALDSHRGQEGIYCLDGEIEFWIEEKARDQREGDQTEQHKLRRGDFVHFDPQRRHGFRSIGPRPARALQILYEEPEIRASVKTT